MKEKTQKLSNMTPRDWVRVLANYRNPNSLRSSFEVGVSLVPFVGLWAAACWIVQYSYLAAFMISALNGLLLVRLFGILHDCGHGSLFGNRHVNDWIGRTLGVMTLTPYDIWRRNHAIHHSKLGYLGQQRGIGDVVTLTVEEYNQRTAFGRLMYRAYRHPLVMFGLGPTYLFILQNRLPLGLMDQGRKYWISAMGTNVAVAAILGIAVYLCGLPALFLVFLPTMLIGASIGVWMFYVQHQFETTYWEHPNEWQIHEAALHGSSHYDLPPILRWFTANIGIHHVHHLYSRIPFYRLTEVLRDHNELVEVSRMTIMQSLKCASLDLWDEKSQRLISFAAARKAA